MVLAQDSEEEPKWAMVIYKWLEDHEAWIQAIETHLEQTLREEINKKEQAKIVALRNGK